MEENKVVEMENQVEVAEETQAPVAVVEDMLPTENVEETEKPAVPGVVLGAGVVLGGIALYKGVKAGIKAGRKAKQNLQEKLDIWHLRKADEILTARQAAEETLVETDFQEETEDSVESEK